MSLFDQIGGLLQQYGPNSTTAPNPQQANEHFDQVANQVPQSSVAGALSSILGGAAGGNFGQNISQMFGQSNPTQQAGILNTLIASATPEMLSRFGLGGVAGMLGGGGTPQITPQQASQIDPGTVAALANHAQTQNPGIVEEASAFYSQHPTLIKALGGAAVMMAMRHFSANSGQ